MTEITGTEPTKPTETTNATETTAPGAVELRTPRLILRHWRANDEDDIAAKYEYGRNPKVAEPCGWHHYESIEDCRAYHPVQVSDPETFAIVLRETGRPIGCISFKPVSDETEAVLADRPVDDFTHEREIGYWLGEPFWGKGIMSEAVREMLRYGFEDLHLTRVWGKHFLSNRRSRATMERCGLVYHHTEYGNRFPLIGEVCDEDVLVIDAAGWRKIHEQSTGAYRVAGEPTGTPNGGVATSAFWGADPKAVKRPQC